MSHKTRKPRLVVLIAMVIATLAGLVAVATPASAIGPATAGPPTPADANGDHVFLASPTGEKEVFRGVNGNEAGALALAATNSVTTLGRPNCSTAAAANPVGNNCQNIVPITVVNGERIIIEVSDGNGVNCAPTAGTSEFIGFSTLPTVTAIGGNASFDAVLGSSGPTTNLGGNPGIGCAGYTPNVRDQLILTVTDAPNAGGSVQGILIGGVKYDVGSQAAPGDAVVRWADDVAPTNQNAAPTGQPNPPCSATLDRQANSGTGIGPSTLATCTPFLSANAYITNLMVDTTAANAITPGANRAVGDITFTETNFDATTPDPGNDPTVNGVCINLNNDGPDVVRFVDPGTVTVTQGSDVAGTPVLNPAGTIIRIPFTSSTPATKSTFVLSGVLVNTSDFGQQVIDVYQCDDAFGGNPITSATDPGFNSVDTYTLTRRLLVTVVGFERYAGINRNDTARIIADRLGFDCAGIDPAQDSFIIVARNDDFADALAASYVAGQLHSPIVLVNPHGPVPDETLNAIRVHGTTDVFVMGLQNAVGDEVVQQIDGTTSFQCGGGSARRTPEDAVRTLNVQRIGGPTRFGTARQAGLFTRGGNTIGTLNLADDPTLPSLRTMILANGRNFPDAMVAGPMAYEGNTCVAFFFFGFSGDDEDCLGFPILESDASASSLPADTDAFITERNIEQVLLIGGTDAIPQAVEDGLKARGLNVVRISGANRQLTAVDVAKFEYKWLQFGIFFDCCSPPQILPNGGVAIARGDFFTDALALGPLAGEFQEPILLTQDVNTVGPDTGAFLTTIAGDYFDPDTGGTNIADNVGNPPPPDDFGFSVFFLNIAGGTAAVSTEAQQEALGDLVGT